MPDEIDLPDNWKSAAEIIMSLIDAGEAMELAKELPEGPSSSQAMEKYAREYCKVHPTMDLAIVYAVLGVVTCTAAQGGFVIHAPVKGGGILKAPAIQMAMGIAPSGFRKSTALDVGMAPLVSALKAGKAERRQLLPRMLEAAINDFNSLPDTVAANLTANVEQFTAVYNDGYCPKTLTQDATQEAMRNQAVVNGGHVAVIAGEPDILQNVGAYSKNGEGSLSLILNMWDQREIDTTRVSNTDLFIEEASLAMVVLFQTAKFAEVTSGNSNGQGSGSDSYLERGVFARCWVVETNKTGDYASEAAGYSDDDDFELDPNDLMGYVVDGRVTALGAAAMNFEDNLRNLQFDSNEYRMSKAIHRAWDIAAVKYGTELQVPEPDPGARTIFHLNADARLAYRRTQRMMQMIMKYIDDHEDEENQRVWNPTAARFTQHVLREALVVALADGRREVTGTDIEDAATRIIPWRWCRTANALTRRALEKAEDVLADVALNYNPHQEDITATGMVTKILQNLRDKNPSLANPGVPLSKLRDMVRSQLPRKDRQTISKLFKNSLDELVADPTSGVKKIDTGKQDALRNPVFHYTIAAKVNF